MKIFVTGACGQLGCDVMRQADARGYETIGSDLAARQCENAAEYVPLDITNREAVMQAIKEHMPDAVIHCAAWTDVDAAEDNREKADAVNRLGTRYIAEAVKAADAKLLYLSTDYVFDGTGSEPWNPDDRRFAPLNSYGSSKLGGELAVSSLLDKFFIVRTQWVFGLKGGNFIKTMIGAGKTHSSVRVVNDQIGTPTYSLDLAGLLLDMAGTDKYGYYHATNEGGYISRYEFCREAYRQYGLNTRVLPVTTEEYGSGGPARPKNGRLNTSGLAAAGFMPLPVWQDAVNRYLKEAKL